MERRAVIEAAISGSAVMLMGKGGALAKEYYPAPVDETLWQGIAPLDRTFAVQHWQ
jgi:hypothetical protein